MKRLLVPIVVLISLVGGSGAALAGEAPPKTLSVDPATVVTGGTYTLSLTGFDCGVDIPVSITPQGGSPSALTTFASDDIIDGAASQELTAGAPGTYVLEAFDEECQDTAAATLVVTAAPTTTTTTVAPTTTVPAPTTTEQVVAPPAPTAPPTALPATGGEQTALALAAVLALLAGGGLVVAARRR
jgi:LPXTG-motif cell wall-anchored protein